MTDESLSVPFVSAQIEHFTLTLFEQTLELNNFLTGFLPVVLHLLEFFLSPGLRISQDFVSFFKEHRFSLLLIGL